MRPRSYRKAVKRWISLKWDWISAHRMRLVVASVIAVLGFGTIGYMIVGQLNPLDALYMAVITISTVGYGDLAEGPAGRIFSIVYIVIGVAVASATISAVAATMVEGRIREVLGRRRMKRRVDQLEEHIILCGYGRFGQLAAEELAKEGVPYVVIDNVSETVDQAERNGALALHADATEEETILEAGVARARAMLCALPSDADNVYAILNALDARSTAEETSEEFTIVALARDRGAERKLRVAGATNVVQPYEIGARHMAQQILSPHVAKLMGMATERGLEAAGVRMREFPVSPDSDLVGVALKDSPMRREFGVMIVGVISGSDMKPRYNPGPDYVVCESDVLVAVGPTEGMVKLRGATAGAPPPTPEDSA